MRELRKERGGLAATWEESGVFQEEGGEELLRARLWARLSGRWEEVGSAVTQVRRSEEEAVLLVLLDKLLDRLETFDQQERGEFFEKLRWFGPEMAEEY